MRSATVPKQALSHPAFRNTIQLYLTSCEFWALGLLASASQPKPKRLSFCCRPPPCLSHWEKYGFCTTRPHCLDSLHNMGCNRSNHFGWFPTLSPPIVDKSDPSLLHGHKFTQSNVTCVSSYRWVSLVSLYLAHFGPPRGLRLATSIFAPTYIIR